ncbi:PorT family protein [Bacteroidales bacterium OttesenSCG-928-B11]|nr:PorT family protein [Bacteroidales bacterium OttesenSCG-928-C03]MDL2311595.1 PorT family protein [Bacteroidales bacterium OttesenSCG-928-B11]MDL2326720.1 PorT family protein [Bacteroidales bacterium OttesenSCG-928-A14]
MKKLLIVSVLLISLTANAQTHQIGIKSGINFSSVLMKPDFDGNKFKCGYMGGITYNYQFANGFGVGADLLYSRKGYKQELFLTDVLGDIIGDLAYFYHYDYLSIPLKASYQLGNKLFCNFSIGIVPSIAVGRSFESNPATPTLYHNPSLKAFDLGALVEIAGGYTFKEKYTLYAAFAYDQSIINNDPTITQYPGMMLLKKWNCVMNIALGFKYNIGS